MKPITTPPSLADVFSIQAQELTKWFPTSEAQDLIRRTNERYLHWHDFRFRPMPKGLSPELGWSLVKMSRFGQTRGVGLIGMDGTTFGYWLPDGIQRELHSIDQNATGQILVDEPLSSTDKDRYIVNSLMEEAIASSILEGAATTRKKAKEMLREERKPRSRAEHMVLNNYNTMKRITELADDELSIEMLCELQASMTAHTLDDESAPGRLRRPDEEVQVVDMTDGRVLYSPPPASELKKRLELLCRFANETPESSFIHPVIKGIVLHFWLAYEHPFVDGNGRTARALFYWFLLKQKYWLVEFLPISRIILKAPSKYMRAFLYSETDGGDLTYFVAFNVRALRLAIDDLRLYMTRKQQEFKQARSRLRTVRGLNHRQVELLQHALTHPDSNYAIRRHMNTHRIVYQTARVDLFGLAKKGFFKTKKEGRTYIFFPINDLPTKLKLRKP